MNLTNPWGLLLALAAIPVVVLYILKARPQRVRVPSVWLWAAAQRDLHARSPWQKLRRELSLLFELLAVFLLALALGAPGCRGGSLSGNHVAIIIDVSASMGARSEEGTTRMDEARVAALRIVDGLSSGAEAMVLTAGRDPRVLVSLTRNRSMLRNALSQLTAQQCEGDPAAAVALAADRLRGLPGDRRVFLVTDGGQARSELPAPVVPLQLVRVGAPVDNTGIVRLDVRTARRRGERAETVQAFVLLAHHGTAPREIYLTARREGQTDIAASRRLVLPPNSREPVLLEFPFRTDDAGRGLLVELSSQDALASDNVAYGRIPPGLSLPVVLVARNESRWLRRVLSSDPDAALTVTEGGELGTVPPGALLVFDGVCPPSFPSGHDVIVFAPPPESTCAGIGVGRALENPQLSSYETTDPRFRFLTMDGVHVSVATPLTVGARGRGLLTASGNTLIADVSSPDRSHTIVGFDVGESDWPLRASFVLFVRNVEELARAHRSRAVTGGGRTGEPLRVAVPDGVRAVQAELPSRRRLQNVIVTAGSVVLGETDQAGFYRLQWSGGGALAPVNLLSDAESNLRIAPLLVNVASSTTDPRSLVRPFRDLSPWLALVAALLLLADLFWLTRPVRNAKPSTATGGAR